MYLAQTLRPIFTFSRAQQPHRYFEKFTSCMTFGAHKLRSEPFLDYLCKLWQLLQVLHSDMCKKIMCTLSALSDCSGISLKTLLSIIYTKLCAQTFWRFVEFSQFSTTISWKLWRHMATEKGILSCLWKGNPSKHKKLSWSRQTRATRLDVSRGHQTFRSKV